MRNNLSVSIIFIFVPVAMKNTTFHLLVNLSLSDLLIRKRA